MYGLERQDLMRRGLAERNPFAKVDEDTFLFAVIKGCLNLT